MAVFNYGFMVLILAASFTLSACKDESNGAGVTDLTTPMQVTQPAREQVYQVQSLPIEPASIITKSGEKFDFKIEVALTPLQHARGLMFRSYMPPDHGMLFVYPDMRQQSFWMKNTLIPLDMLFVDDKGVIVNIAENTVPHDLTSHRSDGPALAVLELNGGTASRLGIGAGDIVYHREFGNVTDNP